MTWHLEVPCGHLAFAQVWFCQPFSQKWLESMPRNDVPTSKQSYQSQQTLSVAIEGQVQSLVVQYGNGDNGVDHGQNAGE